jgi:ubiquinone/menaquinone biosynthesis C-methylase UbiE
MWEDGMAEFFLTQARFESDKRYSPVARAVARLVTGREVPVVLDLGCGPAILLPELARVLPSARLVGVDPSGPMLELAERVIAEAGPGDYQLMEGRAEDIPLADASVDVVVSMKNLHEWEDAPMGMSEVARVLRPGGALYIKDSNRAYPYWKLRMLTTWLRLTKGRIATCGYLGPYPDAYRPGEVEALLSEAGFEVIKADRRSVELSYIARRP